MVVAASFALDVVPPVSAELPSPGGAITVELPESVFECQHCLSNPIASEM